MGNFIKAEKIIPMLNLNLNIFLKFQINQNITLCSNSDFLQGYTNKYTDHRAYVKKIKRD
jgi:hypothetical protein